MLHKYIVSDFLVFSTCKRFCARWHHNIVELALYTYNIITIIIIIITIITIIIFHLMHDLPDLYVWQISHSARGVCIPLWSPERNTSKNTFRLF